MRRPPLSLTLLSMSPSSKSQAPFSLRRRTTVLQEKEKVWSWRRQPFDFSAAIKKTKFQSRGFSEQNRKENRKLGN